MSVAETSKIDEILNQLRNWPASDRLRLARRILEVLRSRRVRSRSPETTADRSHRVTQDRRAGSYG